MSPRFLWKNQFGEDDESSLDLGAGSISGCPHGDDQCPSAWTDMELGGGLSRNRLVYSSWKWGRGGGWEGCSPQVRV